MATKGLAKQVVDGPTSDIIDNSYRIGIKTINFPLEFHTQIFLVTYKFSSTSKWVSESVRVLNKYLTNRPLSVGCDL